MSAFSQDKFLLGTKNRTTKKSKLDRIPFLQSKRYHPRTHTHTHTLAPYKTRVLLLVSLVAFFT